MNKKFSFLVFLLLFGSVSKAYSQKVKFDNAAWSKILEKSKKENKPIFVDFYATWCGPCKELEANVYTNKKVGKYMNQNFINVKIDAETQELELVKQAGIDSYPTLVYYNSSGEEIMRYSGYRDADEFLEEATLAIEEAKLPSLVSLEKQYKNGDRSIELIENYLKKRLQQSPQRSDNGEILDTYLQKKNSTVDEKAKLVFMENLKSVKFNSTSYSFLTKHVAVLKNIYSPEEVKDADYIDGLNSFIAFNNIERALETKNNASIDAAVSDFLKYCKVSAVYYIDPLWSANELLKPYYIQNDKDKFVDYATKYLETRYGKSLSIDQVKSRFSIVYDYNLKNAEVEEEDLTVNVESQKKLIAENQLNSYLSEDLNNTAWAVFENTEKVDVLKKMVPFSKLSVDLVQSFYNLDTYAQLLHKTGDKKEALYLQKKAARLAVYSNAGGQEEEIGKIFETFEKEYILPSLMPMALDKATLENHLERYNHYNMVLDYDKILDFMPEMLFKVSPRETVKGALEGAFSTAEIFVNIDKIENKIGSNIVIENNIGFAKITMTIQMILDINKMLSGEDSTPESRKSIIDNITNSYAAMYGKKNFSFDPNKNTFFIKNSTEAFAIGDKSKDTWKFINDEAKMKGILSEIITDDIREKLK